MSGILFTSHRTKKELFCTLLLIMKLRSVWRTKNICFGFEIYLRAIHMVHFYLPFIMTSNGFHIFIWGLPYSLVFYVKSPVLGLY
jgi:hypothetical protein